MSTLHDKTIPINSVGGYRENTVSWRYFDCIMHKDWISNIQFYTHTIFQIWWAEKTHFHHTCLPLRHHNLIQHTSSSLDKFLFHFCATSYIHETSQQKPEDHNSQVGWGWVHRQIYHCTPAWLNWVFMSIQGVSVRHTVYSVMNGRGGGSNRNLQIHSNKHLQWANLTVDLGLWATWALVQEVKIRIYRWRSVTCDPLFPLGDSVSIQEEPREGAVFVAVATVSFSPVQLYENFIACI